VAEFLITAPDGKQYKVAGATKDGALAALKKRLAIPAPLGEDDRETRATNPAIEHAPGGMWPFGKVKGTGEVVFDSNAGILGSIISGFTLPGDVASGKVDPNSQEAMNRMWDTSLLASPMSAATKAAETTLPGGLKSLRVGTQEVPTAQQLKAAGSAGLDAARNLGVDYTAGAVKSMGDDLTQALTTAGFFPEVAPKTFALLSKIKEVPEVEAGATAISSLDNLVTLRKSLQKAAGDVQNPTEQAAAARAIDALDSFIQAADPQSVVAGPAAAAGPLLQDARGNYAAAMRSGTVTGAAERAARDADAANSGLNVGNRTRQVVNSILKSDKESRGFSKEELNLMDELVRGKHGINIARWASNVLGGGGGLGAQTAGAAGAAIGGMAGGFPGMGVGAVLAPAAGYALKKLENSLVNKQMLGLDEAVRMRSPLYQKSAPPVRDGMSPEVRSVIERLFLLGVQQAPTGAR
jgi:hypothetical protein